MLHFFPKKKQQQQQQQQKTACLKNHFSFKKGSWDCVGSSAPLFFDTEETMVELSSEFGTFWDLFLGVLMTEVEEEAVIVEAGLDGGGCAVEEMVEMDFRGFSGLSKAFLILSPFLDSSSIPPFLTLCSTVSSCSSSSSSPPSPSSSPSSSLHDSQSSFSGIIDFLETLLLQKNMKMHTRKISMFSDFFFEKKRNKTRYLWGVFGVVLVVLAVFFSSVVFLVTVSWFFRNVGKVE